MFDSVIEKLIGPILLDIIFLSFPNTLIIFNLNLKAVCISPVQHGHCISKNQFFLTKNNWHKISSNFFLRLYFGPARRQKSRFFCKQMSFNFAPFIFSRLFQFRFSLLLIFSSSPVAFLYFHGIAFTNILWTPFDDKCVEVNSHYSLNFTIA